MDVRLIIRESLALLLFGCVIVLALAMYSFTPADPSLNHQTDADVQNLIGSAGAYVSDFLYQLFGYASWLWVALISTVALRMAWGRQPYLGGWSSLFWLPVVLAFATLMQAHLVSGSAADPLSLPAGTGGAIGLMLDSTLSQPLRGLGRDILLITLILSGLVAATHWSLLALLQKLYAWFMLAVYYLIDVLKALFNKAVDRKDRIEAKEVRKEIRKKRPEHIAKSKADVAKPVKVKVSRRAQKEQQTELAFNEPSASGFRLPSLNLFDRGQGPQKEHQPAALQAIARMLEKKLLDYRVEGQVVAVHPGPVVTQFELEPSPGTKVNRIVALQDDLARSMAAISVRVAGNIPGKSVIGIELPNEERESVLVHQVFASKQFSDKRNILPLALGVDIGGQPVVTDLAKMPHLLVAGTTGSGKSVAINAMICSMLMTKTPKELRMIMVDPKMLELSVYDDIPHLLVPVVTNPHKAAKALAWAVYEMERRYHLMSEAKVRNIDGYNKAADKLEDGERLPYIVIVIDELADLMMVAGKEVEQAICRIAQKARAAGLHLILATQRPSVDVITGLIKANLPSRLSFQVSSKIDSRTILDQMGAEQLLGMGDSLFLSGGRDLKRVHGAFVSDREVIDIVEHLKGQGEPDYREEVFEAPPAADGAAGAGQGGEDQDEKYDEAAQLVIEKGQCSVSMVQRYLRIGYNRASRLVEQMEREGLVTAPGSGGIRKVNVRSADDGGGVIE
ncbi:DNA segregation ATPase FtsK/SpoIIIE, S-DNA-T family [Mariprofundus micogutta]|uniref:DNA segregation ATPase FtsK/SpoIIIE, S-DNA-T family n=1 Tax=Mariprofundus micogutta TaxID=1921010 RepID=A0A1L8CP60_9PROT|nr:DNA translocase FtsK [Mariprofundus micogutta]GAV20711.1 DNA segregation ATPase FtsK/SpoIIIE, S-DNA-T family [Mariprofundus micogutta]